MDGANRDWYSHGARLPASAELADTDPSVQRRDHDLVMKVAADEIDAVEQIARRQESTPRPWT